MLFNLLKKPSLWLIPVAFSSISSNANELDKNQKQITYKITITENEPNVAQIHMKFIPEDSILYMDGSARAFENSWGHFLHDISAYDQHKNKVNIVQLQGPKWKLDGDHTSPITVTYNVHLTHPNYSWSGGIDGAAYATEHGVFYTGRSLFMLNGTQRNDISVKFDLPKPWKATTPWEVDGKESNRYAMKGIDDLLQSVMFLGTHKEIKIKRKDFELIFALGTKETMEQEEEYKEIANGVLNYYVNLMGGNPNPPNLKGTLRSVVVVNAWDATDGEALGNNISVLVEKDGDEFSKLISRFIFAHEFFHLWNGKSFSPNSDNLEWFKEGVTNYYTVKSLYHIGILNDESYLNVLSDFFYKRYIDDDGVGTLAMSDGEAKHDHWGLVYGGGMFVGMAQDILIRNATNNTKSLDMLMRAFYQKYGGSEEQYDMDEVCQRLSDLSGEDQSSFFDSYIYGTAKFPIETYLHPAGLDASVNDGKLIIKRKNHLKTLELDIFYGFLGK